MSRQPGGVVLSRDLTPALRALVARQAGAVSRRQLIVGGLGRHTVERLTSRWRPFGPGVYFVTHAHVALEPTWESRLWAGLLLGEGGSALPPEAGLPCVGGLAAAVQHRLVARAGEGGPVDRRAFCDSDDIDVYVPPARRVSPVAGYRFVRSVEPSRAAGAQGELTITGVDDTVLDLADLGGPADAVDWVDRACQRRLTTPQRLMEALEARSRARHRARLRALLGDQVEGLTSQLERIYRDQVERPHGLPRARRQARDGQQSLDCDYDWLVVELDGRLGHVEAGRWRDRRRDNRHTVRGRPSLRYGWQECTLTPCEVAWEVGGMLRALGWPGRPTPCADCPPDAAAA